MSIDEFPSAESKAEEKAKEEKEQSSTPNEPKSPPVDYIGIFIRLAESKSFITKLIAIIMVIVSPLVIGLLLTFSLIMITAMFAIVGVVLVGIAIFFVGVGILSVLGSIWDGIKKLYNNLNK